MLYGVVEPNEKELTASASGVGMLVQVGGAENEILASLIVGKAVEGAENQHYVRVPAEDAVYVVEIDSSVFATEFDKWIKGDILNVRTLTSSSWDSAITPSSAPIEAMDWQL